LNVSTERLETLFWTSHLGLVSDWWHWRLGLVSRPSLQCLGLVSVSSLRNLGLISVSASYVSFTTLVPHYPCKTVFSNRRILLYDKSASFRCDGRLFASPGPAAANAVSPKVLYVLCCVKCEWSVKICSLLLVDRYNQKYLFLASV